MKKVRFFILFFIAFLGICIGMFSYADFSGFVSQLNSMDIPTTTILSETGINRYELSRLLNAVECKDCTIPGDSYVSKYTKAYRQNFISQPGRDFDDIGYQQAFFNNTSYYYCVAYVGDKSYMRGYPSTSPICAEKFCGTRATTKAEFLQVIMNLIAKYIYPVYATNRRSVEKWADGLFFWEYAYRTLNDDDLAIIHQRAKECGNQLCSLQSTSELTTYLKYCMFNLKECGMIPFDKIKEGYWPVAELNVLYSQQFISLDNAIKYNIDEPVDGKLAIDILGRINGSIGCSFSNDYDCDGLDNTDDNCPNAYNPQQRDIDNDGIGDVCDDDIDNDGVKNPIGIVDDNGNIIIRLWTPDSDNCLFIVNKDQTDSDKNKIGDICQNTANRLSLTIGVQEMKGALPKTVTFTALTKGSASEFSWDFGDGSVGKGITQTHSYATPGTYIVRLSARGDKSNDARATTTIIVGREQSEKQGLSLLTTNLSTKLGGEGSFSLSSLGVHDSYEWNIAKTTISTKQASLQKKFTVPGTYPISVKAMLGGKIVAATMFSFGVGDGSYASMLSVSSILPDKYQEVVFDTKFFNLSTSSISRIVWDFGDGQQIDGKQTTLKYTYQSVGKKVVLQTIFLNDGNKLQNMVTLFVNADRIFSSYGLQFTPSSLDIFSFQPFTFKTSLLGGPSSFIFANTTAGDSSTTSFPTTERLTTNLQVDHQYRNPGIYYPQTQISLDQCYQLSAQATLAIGGQDFCLQAKLDGSLAKYTCDMDKDGIPDICDDDIDGDGVKNLLGILNPNNRNNCNYLAALTQGGTLSSSALVNFDILKLHFSYSCTLDNAPFSSNTNQLDQNRNGIGDSMESGFSSSTLQALSPIEDTDADGIPDKDDLCPTIPETWNDISDYDGCPELGMETYCDNTRLTSGPSTIHLGTTDIINPDGSLSGTNVYCGNGIWNPGETCLTCPEDIKNCGNTCGNHILDPGETCLTCPEDVGTCSIICGNGKVEAGENCMNCPQDAGSCTQLCGNKHWDFGETCKNCPGDIGNCGTQCGNGAVNAGETCLTCPEDAGICGNFCGDKIIQPWETCKTCPQDVGVCLPSCGNGKIDANETCLNCPKDVGSCTIICGNGIIDAGESCQKCPKDFPSCSNSCGNGKIDANETCLTCPQDVGSCTAICGNGIFEAAETCNNCPKDSKTCSSSCGNGRIDANENCFTCPQDVGSCSATCGNGIFEAAETCNNCPKDSKTCSSSCGNGKIDANENCFTCPQDVGSCSAICGNGIPDVGETCFNCPQDNKTCSSSCGNGRIDANENCFTCPQDVGSCTAICGNGIPEPGENCSTCSQDIKNCSGNCGNSVIEPLLGETCDNGNSNGKDGKCSSSCQRIDINKPISCGNGKIDPGELCSSCAEDLGALCITQCGNGTKELSEECDNGINNGKDGKCSLLCKTINPTQPTTCGNGLWNLGETCLNCPQDLTDICITQCGNGTKELSEECDNGINNGKDGKCSLLCKTINPTQPKTCGDGAWDLGESCLNCPQDLTDICVTQCGNGIKELSEECDNGINNGKEGNSCSLLCKTINPTQPKTCGDGSWDLGESCLNCPQDLTDICVTQCGNGIKELSEECDNGINNGKDGKCSLLCKLVHPGKPPTCGNGKIDIGETCLNCPEDLTDLLCSTLCGNGSIELSEECDNGTNNGKDGKCSSSCQRIDPNKPITCGNGNLDIGENCSNCITDIKDTSLCLTTCGNGSIEGNEQCDNGANNGIDGICTPLCLSVYSINGPDQGLSCGNGKIDPGETCSNCPDDVGDCLYIITPPCMQCPCPFADVDSKLSRNDVVKAVLRDKTKKYSWKYSAGLTISY